MKPTVARLAVLGGILAVAMPGYGMAQQAQPTARLRAVLVAMPAEAVELSKPMLAFFADPRGRPDAAAGQAEMPLAGTIPPLRALAIAGPAGWSALAGVWEGEAGSFLTFGDPPDTVTIWSDLADAGTGLVPKLADLGFAALPQATGVYGNGEPGALDLASDNPGNPWRLAAGQATFVAVADGRLIQSATPGMVEAVRAADPSAADLVFLKSALNGVDAAIDQGRIGGAILFSAALGLNGDLPSAVDPSGAESLDMESTIATLTQQITTSQPGIPPYLGGVLVDATIDDLPALVISIPYPDCAQAGSAAKAIAELWTTAEVGGRSFADRVPGTIATDSVDGSGACAAVVTMTGSATSRPFDMAFAAIQRREFAPLRIALP